MEGYLWRNVFTEIYGWLFFHLVRLHTHSLKTKQLDCVAGCGWLVGWLAALRPRFST